LADQDLRKRVTVAAVLIAVGAAIVIGSAASAVARGGRQGPGRG